MKNYMLKIWTATPDCKEMSIIEYNSTSDFEEVNDYIKWKSDRLADKWGKDGFILHLIEAWEIKKIYSSS